MPMFFVAFILSGLINIASSVEEVDETGLLQKFKTRTTKRGKQPAAVASQTTAINLLVDEVNLLVDEENIAYQQLEAALKPLAKIEAGTVPSMDTTKDTGTEKEFVTHKFQKMFEQIPVVVATLSSNGGHPADVRVFDVTKTEFKVTVVEPKGTLPDGNPIDGPHLQEDVDFLAVVPGEYVVGGVKIQAGFIQSSHTVGSQRAGFSSEEVGSTEVDDKWYDLKFEKEFAATPALLTSLNSIYNDPICWKRGHHVSSPWLTVAQHDVSKVGAKLTLERSEVDDNSLVDANEIEEIGWIAVEAGKGHKGGLSWKSKFKKEMGWKNKKKTKTRLGFEDAQNGRTNTIGFKFMRPKLPAITVASKSSRNGGNGGWARIFKKDGSSVAVAIDEDMYRDTERNHTAEDVSMVGFSSSFTTCLEEKCCDDDTACAAEVILAHKAITDAAKLLKEAHVKLSALQTQAAKDAKLARERYCRKSGFPVGDRKHLSQSESIPLPTDAEVLSVILKKPPFFCRNECCAKLDDGCVGWYFDYNKPWTCTTVKTAYAPSGEVVENVTHKMYANTYVPPPPTTF